MIPGRNSSANIICPNSILSSQNPSLKQPEETIFCFSICVNFYLTVFKLYITFIIMTEKVQSVYEFNMIKINYCFIIPSSSSHVESHAGLFSPISQARNCHYDKNKFQTIKNCYKQFLKCL